MNETNSHVRAFDLGQGSIGEARPLRIRPSPHPVGREFPERNDLRLEPLNRGGDGSSPPQIRWGRAVPTPRFMGRDQG